MRGLGARVQLESPSRAPGRLLLSMRARRAVSAMPLYQIRSKSVGGKKQFSHVFDLEACREAVARARRDKHDDIRVVDLMSGDTISVSNLDQPKPDERK
jgi:hypothetical protein